MNRRLFGVALMALWGLLGFMACSLWLCNPGSPKLTFDPQVNEGTIEKDNGDQWLVWNGEMYWTGEPGDIPSLEEWKRYCDQLNWKTKICL